MNTTPERSGPRVLSNAEVGSIDCDLLQSQFRVDGEVAEIRLSGFYSVEQLEGLLRDLRQVQSAVDAGQVRP